MKTFQKILLVGISAIFLTTQAQAIMYFARPYDPNLQRWLTRDPFGENGFETLRKQKPFKNDDANLYLFVMNNPLTLYDPLGLDWADRYAQCLEIMDPHGLCPYATALQPGTMATKGLFGKVCRRVVSPLTGWCVGISYGCMIEALEPPTPPNRVPPPFPAPPGYGCSTCPINNPTIF